MSSETSRRETRRVYEEIVLSNHERLVYSPAGCTPRLSSILLVFLAPIFFLGLGGNIFCAYWYLVDEAGVWEEFRQIMSSSNFTRSGSGYATAARLIGEKNVVRVSTHATTLPMKKIATIATTMPMITKVGLDLSSAIILRC